MKIFVGTLYTIENEFQECLAAIEAQSYPDFQHFIFQGLPNKQAHSALYQAFTGRTDEFEIMVKVDADMVIEDRDLFAKIVDRFAEMPQLKDLEIAVYDFYSDQLIWGMHAYRNSVRWQQTEEDLFVDRCRLAIGEHVYDDTDLAPAAYHCKNPSPFQGFYYGVHKALKMIQPGRRKRDYHQTVSKWEVIQRTHQHFMRTGDRRLGFAVLGAERAFRGDIEPAHLDCTNPLLRQIFEPYTCFSATQLARELSRFSMENFGYLPPRLRRSVLVKAAGVRSRHFARRPVP